MTGRKKKVILTGLPTPKIIKVLRYCLEQNISFKVEEIEHDKMPLR